MNNNGALIVNQTVCPRCLLLDDDVLGPRMAGRWWSFRADVFAPLLTEIAPSNHRLCSACGQPQLVRSGSTDQWLGCGLLAEPSDGCQKNLFNWRSAIKGKKKQKKKKIPLLRCNTRVTVVVELHSELRVKGVSPWRRYSDAETGVSLQRFWRTLRIIPFQSRSDPFLSFAVRLIWYLPLR